MKKIWNLASKDEEYLKLIETISHKAIDEIPEQKGNGKAKYIPLMTKQEYNEYLKNQEPMWKQFYDKIKSL